MVAFSGLRNLAVLWAIRGRCLPDVVQPSLLHPISHSQWLIFQQSFADWLPFTKCDDGVWNIKGNYLHREDIHSCWAIRYSFQGNVMKGPWSLLSHVKSEYFYHKLNMRFHYTAGLWIESQVMGHLLAACLQCGKTVCEKQKGKWCLNLNSRGNKGYRNVPGFGILDLCFLKVRTN